jgi:hypothetical protein
MNGPHATRGWAAAAPLIAATGVQLETLSWLDGRLDGIDRVLSPLEDWSI